MDFTSLTIVVLSLSVIILIVSGLITRCLPWKVGKGIGWQFIRYNVVVITLPMIGLLIMTDKLDSNIGATIFTSILAYSFGKAAQKDE